MRLGIVFIAFIVLIFSSGCNRTVKYKTVDHYNVFEVDLPSDFQTLIFSSSDSQFQLGNHSDEFYISISYVGFKELGEIGLDYDLNMYSKACLQLTLNLLESPIVNKVNEEIFSQNNMNMVSYVVSGFDKTISKEAFYYISFFEANSNFYDLVSICLQSDKEEYLEVMKHIHSSFKEK